MILSRSIMTGSKDTKKPQKKQKTQDADLRRLFNEMASESRGYISELERHVSNRGGSPADGTTVYGDIYRGWMDVKATFTGKDRKGILGSCEFGEDAAQRAYEKALKEDDLSPEVRQVISAEKASLRTSHDKIKRLRDTQPAG